MGNGRTSDVLRYSRSIAEKQRSEAVLDGDLLERFTTRSDSVAFASIVRRHGPMVLQVCRRLLPSEQDAEDAHALHTRPPGRRTNDFSGFRLVERRKAASNPRLPEYQPQRSGDQTEPSPMGLPTACVLLTPCTGTFLSKNRTCVLTSRTSIPTPV